MNGNRGKLSGGAVVEETVNVRAARMIFAARTSAGLSQHELAELLGTKQPAIARLEDADYEGHSLSMLQRIAKVLGQRIELRFVPDRSMPKQT